jgi:hypothetical protein
MSDVLKLVSKGIAVASDQLNRGCTGTVGTHGKYTGRSHRLAGTSIWRSTGLTNMLSVTAR